MNNKIYEIKNKAEENLQAGKKEIIRSSKDWFNYIQTHPLQSMVFGAVIFLAIKNIFK